MKCYVKMAKKIHKLSNAMTSPFTLRNICYCVRLSKAENAQKIITFKQNI